MKLVTDKILLSVLNPRALNNQHRNSATSLVDPWRNPSFVYILTPHIRIDRTISHFCLLISIQFYVFFFRSFALYINTQLSIRFDGPDSLCRIRICNISFTKDANKQSNCASLFAKSYSDYYYYFFFCWYFLINFFLFKPIIRSRNHYYKHSLDMMIIIILIIYIVICLFPFVLQIHQNNNTRFKLLANTQSKELSTSKANQIESWYSYMYGT